MAADILLYQTEKVPVGEDQIQHIEMTRDLAKRFNSRFGETFNIPEAILAETGARIMGLDDPSKKMSKSSSSSYNFIALTDNADTVSKKIKKAVTDSGDSIAFQDDKPALKNLLTIYGLLADKQPQEIVNEYSGKSYREFKDGLTGVINEFLKPVQDKYHKLFNDEDEILDTLHKGALKAQPEAERTLKEVKEKMGLLI